MNTPAVAASRSGDLAAHPRASAFNRPLQHPLPGILLRSELFPLLGRIPRLGMGIFTAERHGRGSDTFLGERKALLSRCCSRPRSAPLSRNATSAPIFQRRAAPTPELQTQKRVVLSAQPDSLTQRDLGGFLLLTWRASSVKTALQRFGAFSAFAKQRLQPVHHNSSERPTTCKSGGNFCFRSV